MLPIPVGILPSAPVGTHLVPGSVTSNSAIIEWSPPDDGSAESYMIAWKPDRSTSSYYSTVSLKERVVLIRLAIVQTVEIFYFFSKSTHHTKKKLPSQIVL